MSDGLVLGLMVGLVGLAVVLLAVVIACVALMRRIWQLIVSLECLCRNVDALRQQIGRGGHEH